jgi:curved DNA-binding protein CbpA
VGTLFIIIIIGAIIYIVIDFNKNKSNKYSVAKREQKSDELVEGKDDIEDYISGYEYRANYWTPYTSLEALNHHRKILRKIKESELPNYGDGLRSHGVWLPFVDNLKPDEPSNEELQDIEFLKKFRETYESDLLHDEKYKIISVLCEEYKDLPLAQNSKNWYLWNLCEISGISESIAEDLYFKGYKSKHDIKKISDEDLLKIKGVGISRLNQIRAYLSKDLNQKEALLEMKVVNHNPTNNRLRVETPESKLIDFSKSQKIYFPKLKYQKSSDQEVSVNKDLGGNYLFINNGYFIESKAITISQEVKKPRGLKFEFTGGTSVLKLKSLSDYLPKYLPHIQFDDKNVSYKVVDSLSSITNDTYRFQESSTLCAFLSSSKELRVHLYNWDLEQLGIFDASRYAEYHTHLRRIELTPDLSCFLITIIDKAYLLDSEMNLKNVWQVPFKEGFEKREVEASNNVDTKVIECLKVLELPDKPSKEEIKIAFRKQVFKWHPDRNPNNFEAEERTRQLIQAYEFLSGENALKAFEGIKKEDFFWVDLSHFTKLEVGGISIEMNFTIGSGEDWIYGAGMSNDGSRIYLGCYSGKIYQINKSGLAEKIYIIPEDKIDVYGTLYGKTNPVLFITEYNDRKYILTQRYLYVLKDDNIVRYLKNENGKYRLFKKGFILQDKKQITLFDRDGERIGMITFKSPILQVCYRDNILLVESTTKAFTFRLNYN